MSQHDPEQVAPVVAQRIEAIVSSAERAANEFRRQMETAAKQQAHELREAAEAEARRIRQEAASQAAAYLTDSRRIVDEFAAERIARISALTDKLIEQTEQVQRRFAHAEAVRRQIYDLIGSLGDAAEAIAREAQTPDPRLPQPPQDLPDPVPSPATGPQPGGETSSAASPEDIP
jgi:cell division septum initiation protein DivIVA